MSIKYKLGTVIAGLVVFFVATIAVTFWTIDSQQSDSKVINLAGRQRMLTQKMTKEALALRLGKADADDVMATAKLFDTSLKALVSGDAELGIPPTDDPETLAQLKKVSNMWNGFKSNLEEIAEHSKTRQKIYDYIIENNVPLLREMNKAVAMMEKAGVDSRIINLAGRQRMLTQKMTKEALAVEIGSVDAEEVASTVALFDRTLTGLIRGDQSLGLKPPTDPLVRGQLQSVADRWRPFKANMDELIELLRENRKHKHMEYMLATNVPLLKAMNAAVGLYERASLDKVRALKTTQIVLLVLTLCVAVAGWFMVIHFIVRPVDKVVEMAESMADGNLGVPDMNIRSRDEVGKLGQALNSMKARFNEILGRIRSSSDHVASAATELSATSSQIVQSSDRQSFQTNQVATAMEEMSATVIEVSRNSQNAAESAAETQEIAVQGGEVVRKAAEGMMSVAETVRTSASTVEALGKSSDEIGAIVAVINDIADQTNLLALNAAIEAARAGEQGRGFAVVADEVRKLAEKTTKATKEIADMIKTIQTETRGAISSMHEGTKQVEEGVQLAGEAGEALQQIVSSVERVTDMVRQIATAAEEQSATSEEITSNVSEISAAAEENAEGIRQMSVATEDLSRVAEELRAIVGTFVLDDGYVTVGDKDDAQRDTGNDAPDGATDTDSSKVA